MKKYLTGQLGRLKKEQNGGAMVLALVLLTIGSLMLPPLIRLVDTGFKAANVFQEKSYQKYAAGSGVDDGVWQIENGALETLFSNPNYDVYDYNTRWSYDLSEEVNGYDVNVFIENVWIPKDISPPAKDDARSIIQTGKLITTGVTPATSTYRINVTYNPGAGEDLKVETMGIWLPYGFTYREGSSNLETIAFPANEYYSVPTVTPHAGGQAVVWNFDSIDYIDLPGVDTSGSPITAEITFKFSSSREGYSPTAISWITTSGVDGIALSWDADTKVYEIISEAGDATAESHIVKSELRKMGSAIDGDYRAIGNSLMLDTEGDKKIRDEVLAESDAQVSDIPADAEVELAYLYWSGWITEAGAAPAPVFSDDCDNMSSWNRSGNSWQPKQGKLRGHANGNAASKYLTLKTAPPHQVDLSGYTEGEVTISWEQTESGRLEGSGSNRDTLWFSFSHDDGDTWSANIEAFTDDNPDNPFEYLIPQKYLTSDFTVRFYFDGFTAGNEYLYLDNIAIMIGTPPIFEDDCQDVDNWAKTGNSWNVNNERFRGHSSGSADTKYLTLKTDPTNIVDLSAYSGGSVTVSWEQSEGGRLESSDRLWFAFSGNDGSSWSSNVLAFNDDNPDSPFEYTIPNTYLTSDFTMRFYFDGFTARGEYLYLDNITMTGSTEQTGTSFADTSVVFKINNKQVYLDDDGLPQQGAQEITASEWSVLENQTDEYSYACSLDVTSLLQEYSDEGDSGNHTGNGKYTVGAVNAETGSEWSYAGWSLIIIYTSPQTKGHQLYLYDDFIFSSGNENVDFDHDGEPGGAISGFIIPNPIAGETDAAKLTCFVGEGDEHYDKDYLYLNSYGLSNAQSPINNVWNGRSPGLTVDGVDIDTFNITWASNVLNPGDTSASIDLPTKIDNWNLIYIILSVRSETTTGGTLDYLLEY
ncbi:MAG: hypothetical protein HOC20_08210 [Chloroflexi bacterium]|jgi:hypothetical protein|nr:hypothetical protein [Chloroflexota bacterium]